MVAAQSRPEAPVSNLEGWPSMALATLGPLAALLMWSLVEPSTGVATLALSVLVALAVVAISG